MKRIQVLGIIFLMSLSCFGQEETVELKFNGIVKKLECEGVVSLREALMDPIGIKLEDGILFVHNNQADYFVHAYNIATGELLFKCAKRGRGPGEVICAMDCNVDIEKKEVWLSDVNQKRINNYSYKNNSEEIAPLIKSFVFDKEHIQKFILVDANKLYCHLIGSNDGTSNVIVSREGELLKKTNKYPQTNVEIFNPIASNIFGCRLDYSKTKKNIVKAYSMCNRIEVLDNEGVLKVMLLDKDYPLPKFHSEGYRLSLLKDGISCFEDVVAGDNSFFVLYSGQNIMEPLNTNTLFEFDYDGKCLHNYKLDKKIKSMDIDFSTNKIYGLGEDDDLEPCVYEFQL